MIKITEATMKIRFLLPIVALIFASLSCNIPFLSPEPEEGDPIITSQIVTPAGGGNYSAAITISPHIITVDLFCSASYYDQEEKGHSQLVYSRTVEPSTTDVVVNFEFSLLLPGDALPHNTTLQCTLSDYDTERPIYEMITPFSIPVPAGQVTETPTETPKTRTATLTFTAASGELILPGCWEADGTVRLNIEPDGTLHVECGWESPLDFTITAKLTGKWDIITSSINFRLEQTVIYKFPGGITGTVVSEWDGNGTQTSIPHSAP
jgi:hypothetical protein